MADSIVELATRCPSTRAWVIRLTQFVCSDTFEHPNLLHIDFAPLYLRRYLLDKIIHRINRLPTYIPYWDMAWQERKTEPHYRTRLKI